MRIGKKIDNLPTQRLPELQHIVGQWMQLEPISVPRHGKGLFSSFSGREEALWTYMPYGPFESEAAFLAWLAERSAARDPWFFAYVNKSTAAPLGMGAFMRADPKNAVIEIGHIWMSPALQKTREATESIFLMMRYAFDTLGVRRLEWKCDSLNAPSQRAAERFGFAYEGIFRQHMIIKGRNRDTAWFAMMDHEWPDVKAAFEAWLKPENFDVAGAQMARLRVR
jgi:RimJ/RimL family protein N-acetyltransferase